MAEELRHGYQMLHLLLSKDWSHVSGGVTGPQMVEEILSMTTGNHVLDAFNLDYDSFMDNITFAAFIDRVGKYQLTMQKVCAYKPSPTACRPCCARRRSTWRRASSRCAGSPSAPARAIRSRT